ncbi:hypothetical protein M8C21_000401 [Ambrosia artemisiifolia]|uniref:Uncharacterized protein n=1 Tax=Ambrosia artemisiifolia TaxID=4212 RepID=A0AAD5CQB5_AMBAR|nr:hypothetical protein M8C21_000401 [Ambrosia artemisiifolia]
MRNGKNADTWRSQQRHEIKGGFGLQVLKVVQVASQSLARTGSCLECWQQVLKSSA